MEDPDYSGMLLNWAFFFAIFGGAIYAGVLFAKLARRYNQNRFIFAAVGFLTYLIAIKYAGQAGAYLKLGEGYLPAFSVVLTAAAIVAALYIFLKNLWGKKAS